MACFLAPVAEAIVVSVVKKFEIRKEKQEELTQVTSQKSTPVNNIHTCKIPLSRKLGWLTKLLWGGAFLLAIEHIWHGEVVPWPPFLTAMNNPADVAPMLHEIATVGITMAVVVTIVWCIMLVVSNYLEHHLMDQNTTRKKVEE